ncbi:MAG: S8 family peptidase [Crocinitomicaceae bacterium]|nr:S8 family peptidase [Crocinitomicaceae bacterium]
MKSISILLLILSSALYSVAQDTKIIFLKENTKQTLVENPDALFTEKSLERREKENVSFDHYDLPVNKEILAELSEDGEVLSVSKWLNALTFISSLTADELMAKYNFIDRIQVVNRSSKSKKDSKKNKFEVAGKSLDYGVASVQLEQINLDCLHDMGFTGDGVYVGVIDAGFHNMHSVSYFDALYLENRVMDSFNFVTNGQTIYGSSGHGTAVTSCIVGEGSNNGQYIGAAVDSDLALYLSEDVNSETEIEEFYLVQALERADSMGVEVVNISLGYFGFDDSTTSHVYADLDGATTIAAMGVNIAKSKGIFVVSAAGNSGPSNISTPCDATGGFCVGAVTATGDYAWFSSVGPTADGRVKPDVMARGGEAWFVNVIDSLEQGNGTSLATPIIAGGVACLIQAHPSKTVDEIMDAIRESASVFTSPNDTMGYGIPDFCLANAILNDNVSVPTIEEAQVSIYPNPTAGVLTISGLENSNETIEITLFDNLGRRVFNETKIVQTEMSLNLASLNKGMYHLVMNQAGKFIRRNISVSK